MPGDIATPLAPYLHLTLSGAALFALPFSVRMLWTLVAPRSPAAERSAGLPFVVLSCLAALGSLFAVRWFYLPFLVNDAVRSAWCRGTGARLPFQYFTGRASLAVVALALCLELCLIGVVVWRSKRA